MSLVVRLVLLAAAFALATATLGWWTVPLLGGVWGAIALRGTRPVATAAAAAGVGWLVLLLWAATQGPVWLLARKVGPILMVPGWLFVGLTLMFPVLLAGSAAALVTGVRGLVPGVMSSSGAPDT